MEWKAFLAGAIFTIILEGIGIFFFLIVMDKVSTYKLGVIAERVIQCFGKFLPSSESSKRL